MLVAIALAHNYPHFEKKFVMDLIRMQTYFNEWVLQNKLDHKLVTVVLGGGYNLDRMRDDVTVEAISTGADYILYLDTDMSFPQETIVRLMQVLEGNPTFGGVSGIYTAKREPYLPHIFVEFNNKKKKFFRIAAFSLEAPFPIEGCGAGVFMVRSNIFKKITRPYFRFVYENEMKELPHGCGEDLYLCWKLKKAKVKLLCDPAVRCGHYDTRAVTLSNYVKHNGLKEKDGKILCSRKDLERMESKLRAKKAR